MFYEYSPRTIFPVCIAQVSSHNIALSLHSIQLHSSLDVSCKIWQINQQMCLLCQKVNIKSVNMFVSLNIDNPV